MRMLAVERSREEWLDYLGQVHSLGIQSLHSSLEYDSFGLLTSLLRSMARNGSGPTFRHIVKLAEPSFDDHGFAAHRLERKVRDYCTALSTPVVHDLQWMWRQGLSEDTQRVNQFRAELGVIGEAVARLKQEGLIERFFCFPYSLAFGRVAVEHPAIDGLVVYRNLLETDYEDLIDRSHALSKRCQIIRPFNAGSVLGHGKPSPEDALRFALDKPAIESTILSSNSIEHLRQLMPVFRAFQ
jgi:aryl-alcohol dehydrogenase-like predicted oxidoreductase